MIRTYTSNSRKSFKRERPLKEKTPYKDKKSANKPMKNIKTMRNLSAGVFFKKSSATTMNENINIGTFKTSIRGKSTMIYAMSKRRKGESLIFCKIFKDNIYTLLC